MQYNAARIGRGMEAKNAPNFPTRIEYFFMRNY